MADDQIDDVMSKCGIQAAECKALCEKGCACFIKYDRDGNGTLSKDEIATLLADGMSNMNADTVFSYCDLDNNGKVTKEEFIKGLVCTCIEDNIKRVFNSFDTDGSGSISKSELKNMAGGCEESGIDRGSLERVLAKYDTDSSGNISFDEFKEAFFS